MFTYTMLPLPSLIRILSTLEDHVITFLTISTVTKALQQSKWLEEVRSRLLLDVSEDDKLPRSAITLEQLRKLIDSGINVAPCRPVERAMAELQELLTLSEAWEDKSKACLSERLVF